MTQHVIILGAYGSAGVAVAQDLASREDIELTLIDDGEPGGGLCILRGCMPSKAVFSDGAHKYQAEHEESLSGSLDVDLHQTIAEKNDHIFEFAEHRRETVHELATQENVEFIHKTARFEDDRTVAIDGRTIEGDYVVIATGSRVHIPDIPGINEVDYMTSADVLDTSSFPETGLVMGFGYVGLEMVPYLSEVGGMDLTVIEHDEIPLHDQAAPAFGERIMDLYREEFGIEILTNTREKSLEAIETDVRLRVEQDETEQTLEADQLFLFTGRRPALDTLGLDNTSLDPKEGWVEDTMQATDDSRVYVVGDANGREPLTHVAKEQAQQAATNIRAAIDGEELTPYAPTTHRVIFSGLGVYPFARLGLTEDEAIARGHDCITVSREATDDGIFRLKNVPRGLAILVVDADDGTVLGYQGFHHHADVMAKTMQVVIELDHDVRELPSRAYHPTTPELLDGLFREASDRLECES
jgi:pyruvate/2-oxoglutarate dehydrogenase complex dihydrolipoamide dehydrogenase (E3) component